MLTSILTSFAEEALRSRPGDITTLFGLQFPHGFMAAIVPESSPTNVAQHYLSSIVVSSGDPDLEHPLLQVIGSPRKRVGTVVGESLLIDNRIRTQIESFLLSPLETVGPCFRRFAFRGTLDLPTSSIDMLLEHVMLVNKQGIPVWTFVTPKSFEIRSKNRLPGDVEAPVVDLLIDNPYLPLGFMENLD